jgi:SAM-dependent methyltransferase
VCSSDLGCGTGGNLKLLSEFGRVRAMELSDVARDFATRRAQAEVQPGRLPTEIPFPGVNFDLIALMDVLEHLADDQAALRGLRARLKPGGWLLVTVPAWPFLWSHHDETHHHQRRYVRKTLRAAAQAAGFTLRFDSYFNTLLFPAVAGVRLMKRLTGSHGDDQRQPGPCLNRTLLRIFSSERRILRRRIRFPIGVSLLLLAQNGPEP